MKTFFTNYEWHDRICGVSGTFSGDKLYTVDHTPTREKLVSDVLRILKTKECVVITFSAFSGYDSEDLLRLIQNNDGTSEMSVVTWGRNFRSEAVSAHVVEHLLINKRTVRQHVEQAIEQFSRANEQTNEQTTNN